MNKASYILILIVVFFSKGIGLSQNDNPFEIKAKSNKQILPQTQKNVFDFNDEIVDTSIQESSTDILSNPFELNAKKSKEKESSIPKTKSSRKNKKLSTFSGSSDFLLWVFLFMLVFIAILLSINRNLISKIIKVIWYYNYTNSLLRNFNTRDFLFYFFLFLVFVVNLSIFTYMYMKINHNPEGLDFFLRVLAIISLIYIIKHVSVFIFNLIFPSLKGLITYNFTILLFNISLGLFLIPINLIVTYSIPDISYFFLIFGLIVIGIMYLIRLLRGFFITYNYFSISIFHFFIYLCAFEIIPLLFLYKFFVNYL